MNPDLAAFPSHKGNAGLVARARNPLGLAWLAKQNAPQPYLTSVPAEVFLHQLVYQLRAAKAAGFRAAVAVTGHYGGVEVDMKQVCSIYSRHRPLRSVALADWEAIRYRD